VSGEPRPPDLDTPSLLEQLHGSLYRGLSGELVVLVRELLCREVTPADVLTRGLVAGMAAVGADFRRGVLYVPHVLLAAKAMKAGMEVLRPRLAETGAALLGTMVVGTVKGDIHDIGKNLVAMMMEGAGFAVINLGTNVDAGRFVATVREHRPDILGMSAMLTTTMPAMRTVISALVAAGLREPLTILVGGASLNQDFAAAIGADAYCRDASTAVETVQRLLALRRARAPGGLAPPRGESP
jgi:methanogenic corrinoid protein MtbC1